MTDVTRRDAIKAIAQKAKDRKTGARGLRHLAIDNQGMAVVHQHMAPIARLGRMCLGFPAQQRVGICAGAVGLVAELDAAEITLGALLPFLGGSKAFPWT